MVDCAKGHKVCFVSTIAWPLKFHLGPHIRKISENCPVILVADEVSSSAFDFFEPTVDLKDISIKRKISLLSDIVTVFEFWLFFRRKRFDCVHSIAPKAGLLAMLAATAAGVPVRFHTFTGQVWLTRTGMSRSFLIFMDWLIARLATQLLTDSLSQRAFLITNKIVKPEKIEVLGIGSVVGVDTLRFAPDKAARKRVRLKLGIGVSDIVFIFVGRLNRDKGIADLLQAFEIIAEKNTDAHLLLVGPDEDGYDTYIDTFRAGFRQKIHRVGVTSQPELYMAAADVCCLPSYREGFGSVLIEAAAVGLPTVASRIYGITDAVVDGETGILHEPGNIPEIVQLMLTMAQDEPLRLKIGAAARVRAIQDFSQERLTTAFEAFYRKHGVFGEQD